MVTVESGWFAKTCDKFWDYSIGLVVGGMSAVIGSLAALSRRLWDISPAVTALIGCGLATIMLGLLFLWRGKAAWDAERVRQTKRAIVFRNMTEVRDAAEVLLQKTPAVMKHGISEVSDWRLLAGSILRSAAFYCDECDEVPHDVRILIRAPRERTAFSGGLNEYGTVEPEPVGLSIVHSGLGEALAELRARWNLSAYLRSP